MHVGTGIHLACAMLHHSSTAVTDRYLHANAIAQIRPDSA
jgi:hypothetical protein